MFQWLNFLHDKLKFFLLYVFYVSLLAPVAFSAAMPCWGERPSFPNVHQFQVWNGQAIRLVSRVSLGHGTINLKQAHGDTLKV